MRGAFELVLATVFAVYPLQALHAQDLAPRAYVITPIHSNAVTLTYSFSDGGIFLSNAIPVPDASGMVHVSVFTYFHSFSFFGRTANFTATSPYGVGHFQGTVMDNEAKPYRSGLLDSTFRFSVNLKGGPAMSVKVTGTMAFDRKQYGMNSGIPFIKIADRVEVDLALKVHRLSGAPVNLK